MAELQRFVRPLSPRKYEVRAVFLLPLIVLLSLVQTAPLNASQRMVLAEEYTNSG